MKLQLEFSPPFNEVTKKLNVTFEFDKKLTLNELIEFFGQKYGKKLWIYIADIPADDEPEYTVHHENLGDGIYEFAVCTISAKGQSSPLHASTDHNAEPFAGWYVFWLNSN